MLAILFYILNLTDANEPPLFRYVKPATLLSRLYSHAFYLRTSGELITTIIFTAENRARRTVESFVSRVGMGLIAYFERDTGERISRMPAARQSCDRNTCRGWRWRSRFERFRSISVFWRDHAREIGGIWNFISRYCVKMRKFICRATCPQDGSDKSIFACPKKSSPWKGNSMCFKRRGKETSSFLHLLDF